MPRQRWSTGHSLSKAIRENYRMMREALLKVVYWKEEDAPSRPLNYHTVENRNKRKSLQERRNTLANQMQALQMAMQQGQQALSGLHQSIEGSLALAKHAETWEWNEVEAEQVPKAA
jgi:hypothetical protein